MAQPKSTKTTIVAILKLVMAIGAVAVAYLSGEGISMEALQEIVPIALSLFGLDKLLSATGMFFAADAPKKSELTAGDARAGQNAAQ